MVGPIAAEIAHVPAIGVWRFTLSIDSPAVGIEAILKTIFEDRNFTEYFRIAHSVLSGFARPVQGGGGGHQVGDLHVFRSWASGFGGKAIQVTPFALTACIAVSTNLIGVSGIRSQTSPRI